MRNIQEGFIRSAPEAEKMPGNNPAGLNDNLQKEEGKGLVGPIAAAGIIFTSIVVGAAIIHLRGEEEGFQLPPKLEAGASCQDVIDYMSQRAGDDGYFEAGKGLWVNTAVQSAPEEHINFEVLIDERTQEGYDSVADETQAEFEKWLSKTNIAGQTKINFKAGRIENGSMIAYEDIESHATGPAQGIVCLT